MSTQPEDLATECNRLAEELDRVTRERDGLGAERDALIRQLNERYSTVVVDDLIKCKTELVDTRVRIEQLTQERDELLGHLEGTAYPPEIERFLILSAHYCRVVDEHGRAPASKMQIYIEWCSALAAVIGPNGERLEKEEESSAGCVHRYGWTTCGYPKGNHRKADGSPMDHEFTLEEGDVSNTRS